MSDSRTPDTGKGATLAVRNLSAGYDGRPVVRGIDLDVAAGEIVSVVGANGSGKSSLLKGIIGEVQVLDGSVELNGREITGLAPEDVIRSGVGYVPQVDDVFPPLTVKENLEMGGYLLPPRDVKGRIEEAVAAFPALARLMSRRAGRLSGGERKMLAFARVLMLRPRLFVLDEPSANLAPRIAMQLLDEHVRQLSAIGASILVVEQRAKAVLAISDRTYVVAGGRIRMSGRPDDLVRDPAFVESFLGGEAPLPAESRDADKGGV